MCMTFREERRNFSGGGHYKPATWPFTPLRTPLALGGLLKMFLNRLSCGRGKQRAILYHGGQHILWKGIPYG